MRRPLAKLEVGADLPPSVWKPVCDDLAKAIAATVVREGLPARKSPRRPRRRPRLVVELRGETDV